MNSLLAAAATLATTVLIASGCASTDTSTDNTAAPAPREIEYRTGSHIPIKDKAPMSKEDKAKQTEESQRAVQQMQTTGAGNPKN